MTEPSRNVHRFLVNAVMLLLVLTVSGCAGGLSQSFKQSLSVISPKKIDFVELEYYAKRSKSAYDPIPEIRKAFPLVTRAATIQSVDVLYFVEKDPSNRTQTISVRGTAAKPNVWEDLEIALIPDSILGIPVHRGFQADAAAIYEDVVPYIRKDWPIRLTGHSLGGAVAALLAAYFEKQGYTVDRVVTFGQPKVTTTLPPRFDLPETLRVVNDRDVVPMVPPYTRVRPYEHFAPEVILREGPQYVYLDAHDSDRLSIGEFWRNLTDFSAKDHHMDGYLSNIQGKVVNGSRQVPYLFEENTMSSMVASSN
jgi:pimeloyl-ACP methyl ester carboxylesterase